MVQVKARGDERLLEAARELVREGGFSALTMRKVARRAGVNLAMYHYYFRSKGALLRGLMRSLLRDFASEIRTMAAVKGPPMARLRAELLVHAAALRRNHALVGSLLAEARQGSRLAVGLLVREVLPDSLPVSVRLIEACQARGLLRPVRPDAVVPMLMGAVMGPRCFIEAIAQAVSLPEARRRFGLPLPEGPPGDAELESFVDLLLRGLATAKGRRQLDAWMRKGALRGRKG